MIRPYEKLVCPIFPEKAGRVGSQPTRFSMSLNALQLPSLI